MASPEIASSPLLITWKTVIAKAKLLSSASLPWTSTCTPSTLNSDLQDVVISLANLVAAAPYASDSFDLSLAKDVNKLGCNMCRILWQCVAVVSILTEFDHANRCAFATNAWRCTTQLLLLTQALGTDAEVLRAQLVLEQALFGAALAFVDAPGSSNKDSNTKQLLDHVALFRSLCGLVQVCITTESHALQGNAARSVAAVRSTGLISAMSERIHDLVCVDDDGFERFGALLQPLLVRDYPSMLLCVAAAGELEDRLDLLNDGTIGSIMQMAITEWDGADVGEEAAGVDAAALHGVDPVHKQSQLQEPQLLPLLVLLLHHCPETWPAICAGHTVTIMLDKKQTVTRHPGGMETPLGCPYGCVALARVVQTYMVTQAQDTAAPLNYAARTVAATAQQLHARIADGGISGSNGSCCNGDTSGGVLTGAATSDHYGISSSGSGTAATVSRNAALEILDNQLWMLLAVLYASTDGSSDTVMENRALAAARRLARPALQLLGMATDAAVARLELLLGHDAACCCEELHDSDRHASGSADSVNEDPGSPGRVFDLDMLDGDWDGRSPPRLSQTTLDAILAASYTIITSAHLPPLGKLPAAIMLLSMHSQRPDRVSPVELVRVSKVVHQLAVCLDSDDAVDLLLREAVAFVGNELDNYGQLVLEAEVPLLSVCLHHLAEAVKQLSPMGLENHIADAWYSLRLAVGLLCRNGLLGPVQRLLPAIVRRTQHVQGAVPAVEGSVHCWRLVVGVPVMLACLAGPAAQSDIADVNIEPCTGPGSSATELQQAALCVLRSSAGQEAVALLLDKLDCCLHGGDRKVAGNLYACVGVQVLHLLASIIVGELCCDDEAALRAGECPPPTDKGHRAGSMGATARPGITAAQLLFPKGQPLPRELQGTDACSLWPADGSGPSAYARQRAVEVVSETVVAHLAKFNAACPGSVYFKMNLITSWWGLRQLRQLLAAGSALDERRVSVLDVLHGLPAETPTIRPADLRAALVETIEACREAAGGSISSTGEGYGGEVAAAEQIFGGTGAWYERQLVQLRCKFGCCNRTCYCVSPDVKYWVCSECRRARYCSRRCQKASWREHRAVCLAARP